MNEILFLNTDQLITDVEKNNLIGEAKEFISTIFQACESCDAQKLTSAFLNSPDFVSLINGVYEDYEQTVKKYPVIMSDFKTQKATIIKEKYVVLDSSTILYASNSKWECKMKDDSIAIYEKVALQFLIRKIDNQWKILSWAEGYAN